MSTVLPTKAAHPLLLKYLAQLALHPLRTKALTTGSSTVLLHTSHLTTDLRDTVFFAGSSWKQALRNSSKHL